MVVDSPPAETVTVSETGVWAPRPRAARGTAGPDSDVDLVIVTERPRELVQETDWTGAFGAVDRIQEEAWGRVTSLRTSMPRSWLPCWLSEATREKCFTLAVLAR